MAKKIHRMFRGIVMDEGRQGGTITWLTDGDNTTFVWVPDNGGREDIGVKVASYDDSREKRGGILSADGLRKWDVYNELPVTAPKIHVTVTSVKEPVRVAVATATTIEE